MSFVQALQLHHFRSYTHLKLEMLARGFVVLSGPNGAGKTNLLEALSLLTPGRGLRGAKMPEIQQQNAEGPWAVSVMLDTGYGAVKIGTGLDHKTGKRHVRLQGEPVRSQNALADHLACVWLTPQMDRLFMDSARERRRFLDRLIFAFDPGHAGRLTRYDNALSQRSKILKEGRAEPSWLDGLEAQMAETGVAIAAARLDFAGRLAHLCVGQDAGGPFPRAGLRVTGWVEEALQSGTALEAEEGFLAQLKESRGVDMLTGGAAMGPHKSDLLVTYLAKSMPADQCSTGEQKSLLIGLILAHAQLITAERGAPPLLLLDEVAAHLDEDRRAALYELLAALGGQVWLTGTDQSLFTAIQTQGQHFRVEGGVVSGV